MLGPLIAVAFGYWYFRTARERGAPPWKWAFVGALAFWLPEVALSYMLFAAASPINVDAVAATMVGVFALSFTGGGITAYLVRNRMLSESSGSHSEPAVESTVGDVMSVSVTTSLDDMSPVSRMESALETKSYEGGSPEAFYERMSSDLIARHGPLVSVDYVSHFPKFEIWFCYKDGTRLYSGHRTGSYDIHFLSLGYVGEGPRYARHFLAAAGFDLSTDEIDSIRPGDSIQRKDRHAVILRKDERVSEDESSRVEFSHEREEVVAGFPATYRHYKAPDMATARDFLDRQDVTAQSFFIVVETPEGVISKDRMGVFEN